MTYNEVVAGQRAYFLETGGVLKTFYTDRKGFLELMDSLSTQRIFRGLVKENWREHDDPPTVSIEFDALMGKVMVTTEEHK